MSAGLLREGAALWGIELDEARAGGLERYARLLAGYREANVIGTRDFDAVLREHVLDSLSCMLCGHLRRADSLVDVGSGGGLPGLALAIALPEARVTLVEATGKKVRFLERAVAELGLRRVEVLNARVEEVGRREEHRAESAAATARALARLPVLAEYCIPLLGVGGRVVAMKGRLDETEIDEGRRAARTLGAEVEEVIRVPRLPGVGEKERHLVVLHKTEETPDAYPRRVGVPAARPLGVV